VYLGFLSSKLVMAPYSTPFSSSFASPVFKALSLDYDRDELAKAKALLG
jgi:hypothetical protein